ncbi:MAG: hypothetical protein ACYDA0_13200 [Candidatus Dormibacteraceae bacterium]
MRKGSTLVAAGLAMVVAGAAMSMRPGTDLVQEAQGHCDYFPCVGPITVPLLASALVLLVAGIIVLAIGARSALVAAGFAMVVVGVALSTGPATDIVQEMQGRCDYPPLCWIDQHPAVGGFGAAGGGHHGAFHGRQDVPPGRVARPWLGLR